MMLVRTYLDECHGGDPVAAIQAVNARFATRYARPRFMEWLRGHTPVPAHIREHMRARVLETVLEPDMATQLMAMLDIDPGA